MTDWMVNGAESRRISLDSRALNYGDGLFETVAIRDGRARLWELHTDRLRLGCGRLDLELPDFDACRDLIESAGRNNATAKIIVAASPGERGYARTSRAVDTIVRVYDAAPLQARYFTEGVNLVACQTRLAIGSATAGLKTLNRLEQVLARNEVVEGGALEGITKDLDGNVICGTMSNVFGVRDNRLITPDLQRCGVAGVMRQHIVNIMKKSEYPVTETVVPSLLEMDEVFLSNSQFGILPVRSFGDRIWEIGPVTRVVKNRLAANGVVEAGR